MVFIKLPFFRFRSNTIKILFGPSENLEMLWSAFIMDSTSVSDTGTVLRPQYTKKINLKYFSCSYFNSDTKKIINRNWSIYFLSEMQNTASKE